MGTIKGGMLFTMELRGDAYERGYQHGEALKDSIGRMVEQQFYSELKGRASKDDILKHARKYEHFIRDYSPEIAEEIEGVAKGSGRLFEEVVMLNALEERESFAQRCTCFAASGMATKGGETYSGQTWDGMEWEWMDGNLGVLFKIRRKNGPDILNYTNPGILSAAGLNASGITLNWNTVEQSEFNVGVPTYLIVSEVLKQKTISEALDAVRRAHRAGYFNFVITDETELYDIEGTPKEIDISYSPDIIAHANHFVSERLASKQYTGVYSSSIVRQNRMTRLLKENYGKIDLEKCTGFLRDHVNRDTYSICCHPTADPNPKDRYLSLDAWISVPSIREIWISHGSPCENEFSRYTL